MNESVIQAQNHRAQIAVACGNCMFFKARDETSGHCLRYPPVMVALPVKRADISRGEAGVAMVPHAVNPVVVPAGFCGEFHSRVRAH